MAAAPPPAMGQRLLDEDFSDQDVIGNSTNSSKNPVFPPDDSYGGFNGTDTEQPPSSGSGSSSFSPFGIEFGYTWFGVLLLVLIALMAIWCAVGYCRKKREQRMLARRSQQADRVLGDMQMVPNDDNELI